MKVGFVSACHSFSGYHAEMSLCNAKETIIVVVRYED